MRDDKQKKLLVQTELIGDHFSVIETICQLSKVDFLKSTYSLRKIKEYEPDLNFKALLGQIMVKASVLAGIKGEIDIFTKQDISKMILSSFKELSLEEISKAFELERYSQYDEKTDHFQLFDANYVSAILNKFKKWKVKEKNQLNISAPKEETTISYAEKQKLHEDLVKMIFDDISENGFSSDAWQLYTDLESAGKINPTVEEKKALYKQQLKIYETEEKSFISSKYDSYIIKTHLKTLQDKIMSKNPIESVSNKCRSILVSNYLKNFITDFESFKKEITHE